MSSPWVKWLASLVIGVIVGYRSYGPINSALMWMLGVTSAPNPEASSAPVILEDLQIAAVVLQLVLTVVVVVALARTRNLKRLFGWGGILLGAVLALELIFALMLSGISWQEVTNPDPHNEGRAVAFWFFMLIIGLPMIILSLIFLIGGFVLLRKGRDTAGSDGLPDTPAT